MPYVDNENETERLSFMPHFVFKRIVENCEFSLRPGPDNIRKTSKSVHIQNNAESSIKGAGWSNFRRNFDFSEFRVDDICM